MKTIQVRNVPVALAEVVTEGGATLLTADARVARATRTYTDVRVALAEPSDLQ